MKAIAGRGRREDEPRRSPGTSACGARWRCSAWTASLLDSMVVRMSAKTMPGKSLAVERELRWRDQARLRRGGHPHRGRRDRTGDGGPGRRRGRGRGAVRLLERGLAAGRRRRRRSHRLGWPPHRRPPRSNGTVQHARSSERPAHPGATGAGVPHRSASRHAPLVTTLLPRGRFAVSRLDAPFAPGLRSLPPIGNFPNSDHGCGCASGSTEKAGAVRKAGVDPWQEPPVRRAPRASCAP